MALPAGQMGPGELVTTAAVARRYYLDGKSKVEIADEMKLSRFKVARLLETARETGLVRIEIGFHGSIDVDRSSRLQDAYGLRRAVVVEVPDDDTPALRATLGRCAAELLTEMVTPADVLGLAYARSVGAMAGTLTRLPSCSVVQLTGALSNPEMTESSIELVHAVTRIAGGPAYFFYAPMIVSDASTASALRQQPDVARAIAHFPSVTKAVVGIGGWGRGLSTVYDAVDAREQRRLARLGVVADVSGAFLDKDGEPVTAPLSERMIGVTARDLAGVPEVLAIAYGVEKTQAVRAALRSPLVDSLVTHSAMARELLTLAEGDTA
ncbi:MAG: transcriptional regulator [Actinomycetota bacterium]|nr:transcriptional regulator [Actinomycetota bacterium]